MTDDVKFKVHAEKGDQSGLDSALSKIDELTQKTTAGSKATTADAAATASATKKKHDLLSAVNMLASRIPGLSGVLTGLKFALNGLSLTGVIGGITVLLSIGTMLYTRLFAPMIEGAQKAKIAIKEWIGAANGIEAINARYDATAQKIDNIAKAYDSAAKAAKALADAQAKLEDAKAARSLAAMSEGPAKDAAEAADAKRKLEREAQTIPDQQEALGRRQIKAQDDVLALVRARDASGAQLNKEFKAAQASGQVSDQERAYGLVARQKMGLISAADFQKEYGMTPDAMKARAQSELQAGKVTYSEENDITKKVTDAAAAFQDYSKKVALSAEAMKNITTEVEAGIKALGIDEQTIREKQGGIGDAQDRQATAADEKAIKGMQDAIDKAIMASDTKRQQMAEQAAKKRETDQIAIERANEARRDARFQMASPDQQKRMLAEDIAKGIVQRDQMKASGDTAGAAAADQQVTQKRLQLAKMPKAGTVEPEAIGPGQSGIDAFASAASQAAGSGSSAMSKMAQKFRSSMSGSGFGSIGSGFGKSLNRGFFNKDASDVVGAGGQRLEDNPAKLIRETNSKLDKIHSKLGMRE